MKLSRQTTTDTFGNVSRSHHHGRKHYFLIENASPVELEAMEEILLTAGYDTDRCPCYEDGFGAGFHIDIEDVPAFKAAYKLAKSELTNYIRRKIAQHQGDEMDTMTDLECMRIEHVASHIAQDLSMKRESLSSLRAIGTKEIQLNPYNRHHAPLSGRGWALVDQALSFGTINDVVSTLRALQMNGIAARGRRVAIRGIVEKTRCEPATALKALRAGNNFFEPALKMVMEGIHADALAEDLRFNRLQSRFNHFWTVYSYFTRRDKVEKAHADALAIENPAQVEMACRQEEFSRLHPASRAGRIDYAHSEALEMNQARDWYLERYWDFYESSQGYQAATVAKAHAEALIEDNEFDGIIRDGLTPVQRAIHNSRMGIDIYGDGFKARLESEHAEALVEDSERDAALVDFLFNDNSGAVAEPELTPEQLAVEKFCDERESQYPSMSDIKREGSTVFHQKEGQWLKLYGGEQAEQVIALLELFCKQEEEAAHDQQRAEIAAERASEERLQGFYYGGMDGDYPTDWDSR